MERYSGTRPMDAMPVDPVGEWAAPGGETGLEEPMWQLGLGGGPEAYPERPDEPDCIYYLRTGFCGYGNRCRFNHPPDRSSAMGALRAGGAELPERVGQPICQYYMRTGLCKFGASCKYHHPKHGSGSSGPITLNFYGYPLRPGEKECSYYIKTGQCKFGVTCKFHHPQPAGIQAPAAYPTAPSPVQSSQQYGAIPGNWPIARPAMIPGSYVPGSYGHVVLPVPGWTPYPAPISPAGPQSSQTNVGAGSIYVMPQLSPSAAAYTGQYLSTSAGPSSSTQKEHASFPERPGQPECQYYLRTGDCKFGSTCKYHHPPEWTASRTKFSLSPMGLPLRPGAPLCSHYSQSGICKFGPSCKFDHPMRILSYSPSASSLTDMPVAPYPVGSTNASASVGSIFSKSGPAPQSSSIQQSGPGSTSSSGVEVRSSS